MSMAVCNGAYRQGVRFGRHYNIGSWREISQDEWAKSVPRLLDPDFYGVMWVCDPRWSWAQCMAWTVFLYSLAV